MSEHFDIYCEVHNKRIGGCRCMGEDKTKRYVPCPGEVCVGFRHNRLMDTLREAVAKKEEVDRVMGWGDE